LKPNGFARFALMAPLALSLLAAAACSPEDGDAGAAGPSTPASQEETVPAGDGTIPESGTIVSEATGGCLATDEMERGPNWIMTILTDLGTCEGAPVFTFTELGDQGYEILLGGKCLGIDDDDAGANNGTVYVNDTGEGKCALWEPRGGASGTWSFAWLAENGSCLYLDEDERFDRGRAVIEACGDSDAHSWLVTAA